MPTVATGLELTMASTTSQAYVRNRRALGDNGIRVPSPRPQKGTKRHAPHLGSSAFQIKAVDNNHDTQDPRHVKQPCKASGTLFSTVSTIPIPLRGPQVRRSYEDTQSPEVVNTTVRRRYLPQNHRTRQKKAQLRS
ncbi:hypothetical protein M407DRAFT_17183 [Tulasnella calospora MUT 4182]|uniref:Uncharacterized protein n=1 Tax=Tulasnella calospora MUT 4182 TaxID=1051891 RepID=A0A0C3QM22_9AGAM|nr:hypothetical protein M407DRAFT_17183 [Tulasnella calospora MUT 4182]